jgi:hypothetical protein
LLICALHRKEEARLLCSVTCLQHCQIAHGRSAAACAAVMRCLHAHSLASGCVCTVIAVSGEQPQVGLAYRPEGLGGGQTECDAMLHIMCDMARTIRPCLLFSDRFELATKCQAGRVILPVRGASAWEAWPPSAALVEYRAIVELVACRSCLLNWLSSTVNASYLHGSIARQRARILR